MDVSPGEEGGGGQPRGFLVAWHPRTLSLASVRYASESNFLSFALALFGFRLPSLPLFGPAPLALAPGIYIFAPVRSCSSCCLVFAFPLLSVVLRLFPSRSLFGLFVSRARSLLWPFSLARARASFGFSSISLFLLLVVARARSRPPSTPEVNNTMHAVYIKVGSADPVVIFASTQTW